MNDNETRTHQMFLRLQSVGSQRSGDFAANSIGQQLYATLSAIITEVEGHAASEVSGTGASRQGTTTRRQAREALREDLEAISRTARAMAADVPGLDDKFRLPRGNNDQQLLSAARAFAADAVPFKAQFIAHELPADFLEDLAADIAAMEAAMSEQSGGLGHRVSAGAALDDAMDRGIEVKRKLDVIMKNKYANNPAVLAEWASASHTERAPRRKKGTDEPPAGSSGGGSTTPST
ncbi:MAG: hypothetical protein H7Z16_03755 [Pyrinomonadaceae bacterium]|nr:hypothetical protein [Pyrinomonadaceae bacterium]